MHLPGRSRQRQRKRIEVSRLKLVGRVHGKTPDQRLRPEVIALRRRHHVRTDLLVDVIARPTQGEMMEIPRLGYRHVGNYWPQLPGCQVGPRHRKGLRPNSWGAGKRKCPSISRGAFLWRARKGKRGNCRSTAPARANARALRARAGPRRGEPTTAKTIRRFDSFRSARRGQRKRFFTFYRGTRL